MNRRRLAIVALVFVLGLGGAAVSRAGSATDTPPQLVATYDSLADTILGAKQAEWNLVHSILATTYSHAEATMEQVRSRMAAGQSAGEQIEALATLVAQLGNEGDSSVAAIRKRLIEAGHHHNAAGEQQGIYDEGFVIVTKKAKKALLDSANAIGKLAKSKDAAKLEAEWKKVESTFESLHAGVQM
jgi:hypothetical protein